MKKIFGSFFALLLAAALSACGGGGDSGGGAETGASGPTALTFVGMDIAYDQTEVTAAAGQPIEVTFRNEGTLEHNWLIIGTNATPEEATEEDALAGTDMGVLQPGEEKSIEFTLPAGEYTYVCTVPGHAVAGMLGTLTVE